GVLGQARAFRLLAVLAFAELHVGTAAAAAQGHVHPGGRVSAEELGAAHAAGIGGERAGEAAVGIVGAANKRTKAAGFQVEPSDATLWALARVAAVLARGINVRPELFVERVEHVRVAQFLDVVDRADEILPE